MKNIAILGAGSWGTALSILLCGNGHNVTVWSIDPEEVLMLKDYREHRDKLPGVIVPSAIEFTNDIETALNNAELVDFLDFNAVATLQGAEVEFKLDITSVIDTSFYYTYVFFYKNLFKSDKSWSCFLMPYTVTSSSFGLDVYDNGKLTKTAIKSTSTFPSLRSGNGKLYLLAASSTSIEVYLVRNDLPQTTAIPYNSSYISALKRISDEHEAKLFNAVGQKIDDAYYGTLPDYLKKTIYAK